MPKPKGDARFMRRDAKGRIKESDDMGKSLKVDGWGQQENQPIAFRLLRQSRSEAKPERTCVADRSGQCLSIRDGRVPHWAA